MVRQVAQRAVSAAVVVLAVLVLPLPAVADAAERQPTEQPGSLTPNQLFGGRGLSTQEAAAACGPAAAVAFARAIGQPVTLDTAVAAARKVGWTPTHGMSGPYSQLALLQRLNVPATIEAGLTSTKLAREVRAGRPVIIRTGGRGAQPGHYFVAERFDAASGRFDLAQSALVLRSAAGQRWFSLAEIPSLGTGTPTHAIYLAPGAGSATVVAASARPFTPVAARPGASTSASHVVATGGSGARLRATPSLTAAVVGSVLEGTRITPTGDTVVAEGRTWRKVTVAGGGAAWIDASLLRAL